MSDPVVIQSANPLDAYANHPVFQHIIRNRVLARLRRGHGVTRQHAEELVDGLDNLTIAHAAVEVGGDPPPPPAKGGFFQWLQDHLPQILQIVSIIVSLLTAIA